MSKKLGDVLIGLETEFRSERFPLFRGRKQSFRGIPSSAEEPNSEIGTEWNGMEFRGNISFPKQQQNNLTKLFVCISKVVFSDTIIEIFGCRVLSLYLK